MRSLASLAMDEIGVAIALVGGVMVVLMFFLASRIESFRSRMGARLDRLEGRLMERR
jgi:hypothetical protein